MAELLEIVQEMNHQHRTRYTAIEPWLEPCGHGRRIVTFAIQRSGQHGILSWLCKHLPGSTVHLNNASTCESRSRQWAWKKTCRYRGEGSQRNIVVSMENLDLRAVEKYGLAELFKEAIVIVRDPWNQFASILESNPKWRNPCYRQDEIWTTQVPIYRRNMHWHGFTLSRTDTMIQYFQQILGEADLLGFPFVPAVFNRWFSSRSYRKRLADALALEFTDSGRLDIGPFGGGSSFDKRRFHGRADRMEVLDRWRRYRKDGLWKRYTSYPGLAKYAEKVIGWRPEL